MSHEVRGVSVDWRHRPPLPGADLTDFLALRRVCGRPDFRVDQVGDHYVENERPVLPFLADGLTTLLDVGHVVLGEPDPASGDMRPVLVTATGRARYEQLVRQARHTALPHLDHRRDDGPMTENDGTRWVFDPGDSLAHVVADPATAEPSALVTMCGRRLPIEPTPTFSVPPSLAICPKCY
ncbi:MAG: hypothetical protein ACRDTE_13000 [Pseudonocardiaceae bacterium]